MVVREPAVPLSTRHRQNDCAERQKQYVRVKRYKSNLMFFIRPKILRDGVQTAVETNTKYNNLRDQQLKLHGGKAPLLPFEKQPVLTPPPAPAATPPTTPPSRYRSADQAEPGPGSAGRYDCAAGFGAAHTAGSAA